MNTRLLTIKDTKINSFVYNIWASWAYVKVMIIDASRKLRKSSTYCKANYLCLGFAKWNSHPSEVSEKQMCIYLFFKFRNSKKPTLFCCFVMIACAFSMPKHGEAVAPFKSMCIIYPSNALDSFFISMAVRFWLGWHIEFNACACRVSALIFGRFAEREFIC